ncbi:MAG: ATPase domain-containing protein [Dehalococcoidia bacterium]|tara:strand:+ start:111 stop:824 length:714 start_codon:yes stop_codon:yes gene_type:complete
MNKRDNDNSDIISTGSNEIDRRLGGGIPKSSLMLVEGDEGAGKSTVAQQLVWGGLNDGLKTSIYTTEQNINSLLRQMASLGQDVTDFFLMNELEVYPLVISPDEEDAESLFEKLGKHMKNNLDSDIIVVDALTTFVSQSGGDQIQDFFSNCKSLCEKGKVVICTVHAKAFDEEFLLRIRSLCDAYLRLTVQSAGNRLIKAMEVAKIRGAEMTTGNITGFDVEPGLGIRIVPITRARA